MKGRRGFTLIELTIALVVAGVAVLVGSQVFTALGDASRLTASARVSFDREMNARRWLAAAIASMEVRVDSGMAFDGDRRRLRFSTWLVTADGWFERTRLELGAADGQLVAGLDDGTLVLANGVASVDFAYLADLGADSPWLEHWRSQVSAPRAIRVLVSRSVGERGRAIADTLIFRVGGRG